MPCPGPFHLSHIAYYMYDMCPRPVTDVGLSTLICNVEHTYFHLVCVAASLCCVCLVNVQVSAPYVIVGSTRELYTCLVRHMTRLLLKRFRCLAPAHDSSLYLFVLVIFLEAVLLFQPYVSVIIFYQHIVHVYLGCSLRPSPCLCDLHLNTHSHTFTG